MNTIATTRPFRTTEQFITALGKIDHKTVRMSYSSWLSFLNDAQYYASAVIFQEVCNQQAYTFDFCHEVGMGEVACASGEITMEVQANGSALVSVNTEH